MKNVVNWFEIPVADIDRAQAFYESVLAFRLRREEMGGSALAVFPYDEPATGGCLQSGCNHSAPAGSGIRIYLDCSPSLDAVLGRVEAAGGSIVSPDSRCRATSASSPTCATAKATRSGCTLSPEARGAAGAVYATAPPRWRNRMEPLRQHHDAVAVAGPSTRTTNAAESNPATGRIPPLWGRFFGENVMGATPHRDPAEMRNFGVYSNYESNAQGAFDVTAGVAVTEGATVQIEAGDYLVFDANGPMPHAVVGAWAMAWHYFDAHPEIKRRYVSDFEAYTSPVSATVHVGVE